MLGILGFYFSLQLISTASSDKLWALPIATVPTTPYCLQYGPLYSVRIPTCLLWTSGFANPFVKVLVYLCIFGCAGSLFLCVGSSCGKQGLLPSCGSSHCGDLSFCRAQALSRARRLQKLWSTGSLTPWHVEPLPTRDQIHILCVSRQILNYCHHQGIFPFLNWSIVILQWCVSHFFLIYFLIDG